MEEMLSAQEIQGLRYDGEWVASSSRPLRLYASLVDPTRAGPVA